MTMHELLRILEQRVSRIEKKVDKLFWALFVFLIGQVALTHAPSISSALSGFISSFIGELR